LILFKKNLETYTMVSSGKNTPQMEIGRRRERRRNNNSNNNNLIIKDPLELLNMAVLLDEREIDFLEEPLETGRLYYNQKEFWEAVNVIQKPDNEDAPEKAFAPIILSGLLQNSSILHQTNLDSSEIMNYVGMLRNQAIQRLNKAQQQQQWRKLALLSCILIFLGSNFYYGLATLSLSIHDLGYLGNNPDIPTLKACSDFEEKYRFFCYQADARVWASVRDYPLHLFPLSPSSSSEMKCVHGSCPPDVRQHIIQQLSQIPGRSRGLNHHGHAPYALHTILTQGIRRKKRRKRSTAPESIRWLGDSRLMQLIRPHTGMHILDLGCDIGSLIFAVSPRSRHYNGVALSPAEISTALRLIHYHEVHKLHSTVTFRQGTMLDFFQSMEDLPFHTFYDTVVALESLSRQPDNLEEVLTKMVKFLRPSGKMIIVDDVLARYSPNRLRDIPEANLWSHNDWTMAFARHGLKLEVARDLGLEFTLPQFMEPLTGAGGSGPLWFQSNALDRILEIIQRVPPFESMARLFRHVLQLHQKEDLRSLAHQRGDLLYVLYIVSKAN